MVLEADRTIPAVTRAIRRWHLLYTLIHNPTLVADRRQGTDAEEVYEDGAGLGKSKAEIEAGLTIARTHYQEYLKLRERLAYMEVQIYGKHIKKRKRKSVSCQATYEELVQGTTGQSLDGAAAAAQKFDACVTYEHHKSGQTNLAVDGEPLGISIELEGSTVCTNTPVDVFVGGTDDEMTGTEETIEEDTQTIISRGTVDTTL